MRHHNKNKKFGLRTGERTAMFRAMTISLIEHGKITTTEARAKSLRPQFEQMITKARGGDVASLRLIKARLGNNSTATEKLFKEIAPKYKDRKGGYTRITKLGARSGTGDAAEMAVIELV